jgi:hypothetical protein
MNIKDENLTKNEQDPKQGPSQNYAENSGEPHRNDLVVQPLDSNQVNENHSEERSHAEEFEKENANSANLYEDQQIDSHDPDETEEDEESALIDDEDDDDELFDDDDDESVEERQDDEQSSLDEDDRHNGSII